MEQSVPALTLVRSDMMKSSRDVYCVKCSTIVSWEQAEQIFKTGFYKVTTPLAICTKCAHGETEKLQIEIEPAKFSEGIYQNIHEEVQPVL
jgi:hypothetical protein